MMKKTITLMMLALMGMPQAAAQDYEYVPFVREGVKWVYDHSYADSAGHHCPVFTLELKGDTLIGGKSYKAMHKYSGEGIDMDNDTVPVYLREEGKVVYGIVPEGRAFDDCPIGNLADEVMMDKIRNGEEFVLYDFNDPITFIKGIKVRLDAEGSLVVQMQDVIPTTSTISGKKVNRYIFGFDSGLCMIEGIGFDGLGYGYTLSVTEPNVNPFRLCRVIDNGEEVYRSERYNTRAESDKYLPLVREGVQWVNERVIVDHGDTTRYFYKYEFKGAAGAQHHPNCFQYTGRTMDESDDVTLAARAYINGYEVAENERMISFYPNSPLEKVIGEGREMVLRKLYQPVRYQIYSYGELHSDIGVNYTANFYINHQLEPFLTRDNLVEVEPLTIDGVMCDRFAYVGEQGDTLAYIVEGIGFDSRDMGDLLTPFTRKPDPDADYQEYCGLSHVVKDGKVIYKGLRWRDETMTGIDEVVAEPTSRPLDENYYDLTGHPVGKDVPTAPGIYIHHGQKIVINY